MKLIYSFLIVILCTPPAISQPVKEIQRLLTNKKFVPFEKHINALANSNPDCRWEVLRDIIGDYKEGIVTIMEEVQPANDQSYFNHYSIYLLTTKDRIFYYRFVKVVNKQEKIIESFNDTSKYHSFENLYKQTYGDTLNHADLFLTNVVYGSHCGFVGVDPVHMSILSDYLQNGDLNAIRKWLVSPNAEKQLYALLGYRALLLSGYVLAKEEKRILSVVEQKKVAVSTCIGCSYMSERFQDIVDKINTRPIRNFHVLVPGRLSTPFRRSVTEPFWSLLIPAAIVLLVALYFIGKRNKKGT